MLLRKAGAEAVNVAVALGSGPRCQENQSSVEPQDHHRNDRPPLRRKWTELLLYTLTLPRHGWYDLDLMSRRIARSIVCLFFVATSIFAADISGIWVGQQPGRPGREVEDLAFQFKVDGHELDGKAFGDEFDLPISGGSLAGDRIVFTVTTTNYYNGTKKNELHVHG